MTTPSCRYKPPCPRDTPPAAETHRRLVSALRDYLSIVDAAFVDVRTPEVVHARELLAAIDPSARRP